MKGLSKYSTTAINLPAAGYELRIPQHTYDKKDHKQHMKCYKIFSSPSAPPGNTGKSRLNSIPPNVIASIKLENTRPVGRDVVPLTLMREGTHMNTEVTVRVIEEKEGKI